MSEYHKHSSCNKCSKENEIKITDTLDGRMMECETKCKTCGFEDYWAHGFFESSQYMISNCKKYSFNKSEK